MANNINCPKCGHSFALGEAQVEEYKKELRQQMAAYKQQKQEELRMKEEEFERQKSFIIAAAQKRITDEMKIKLTALEEETTQKTQQLQLFQRKELELLRQKNELEQKARPGRMKI